MRVLYLSLIAYWYNLIESGKKPEEYREVKPYWVNRLGGTTYPKGYLESRSEEELVAMMKEREQRGLFSKYTHVQFSYGYTKRSMLFEIKDIVIGNGKAEWGTDKEVFVIKLGRRIDSVKYRPQRRYLGEAMNEERTFNNVKEMFEHIEKESCGVYKAKDMSVSEDYGRDLRIDWSETRYVCISVMGGRRYDTPQCIGFCSLEGRR